MDLIVDGYNVLFKIAWLEKEPRKFVLRALQCERENLIRVLSSVRQNRGVTVIVFDGQEKETREEGKGPLIVVFTAKGKTADDYIINLVANKKIAINRNLLSLTNIVVVTGDRELKGKIGSRAKVKKPRWFFH